MNPKEVIIVSYYWPPAGGPGVQRWLKFVKYLPSAGIHPTVIVPKTPAYPVIDTSIQEELPEAVRVIKVPIWEPLQVLKRKKKRDKPDDIAERISQGIINTTDPSLSERLLLWVRGNFFIPDARKFWVKPVKKIVTGMIKSEPEKYAALITTGPPHSVHLAGLKIKKQTNINWMADFRDPWVTIGYHSLMKMSDIARSLHAKMEQKVLKNCDAIVVTSRATAREFAFKTEKPIHLITNGYDVKPNQMEQPAGKFTVAHVGTLLSRRNPEALWEALSRLVEESPAFAKAFQLKLIGNISPEVLQSVAEYNLTDFLVRPGYLDHDEALKAMYEAQVLLLIEIDSDETKEILPGKFFEYLASRRPILGIGPSGSIVEEMLRKTDAGRFYTYRDAGRIRNQTMEWFERYQNNSLTGNETDVSEYHRKQLAGKLAEILNEWE